MSEAKGLWKVARDWSGRIRLDQGNGLSVETWRPEIAERIVTDHNALAGIADPAAVLQAVRDWYAAEKWYRNVPTYPSPPYLPSARELPAKRRAEALSRLFSAMQSEGS